MVKVSKKNRKPHLRHLAALAAIGLISWSAAAPALAGQIGSNGNVTNAVANDGLEIVAGDGVDTTATWYNNNTPSTIATTTPGGLKLSDGDQATAGRSDVILRGAGTFEIATGDIVNDNHVSDSKITIINKNGQLVLTDGNIAGNNNTTLTIESQGTSNGSYNLKAENADVTGQVTFQDIQTGGNGALDSHFLVGSIGEEDAATVQTRGPDDVYFEVKGNFGRQGGSSLDLGGDGPSGTTATIGGNIGSNTAGAAGNSIILNGTSTLNVAGEALGTLTVTNKNNVNNSFSLNTLGDSGDLLLDGKITIQNIVGNTAIEAQDGVRGDVYLVNDDDADPSTPPALISSYANLGSSTADLNLTLGKNQYGNASTGDMLYLHMGDTIVGSSDGATSTTVNIDTSYSDIRNKNNSGNPDVSGHVNINLMGDSANELQLGELTAGSNFAVGTIDPTGAGGKTVSFDDGLRGGGSDINNDPFFTKVAVNGAATLIAGTSEGNLHIVNSNQADKSVRITEMGSGILNVGSGNVADPNSPNSVWVDALTGGADLTIASVKNADDTYDRGQVVLNNAATIAQADSIDPTDSTTISLKNVVLQVTDAPGSTIEMGWHDNALTLDSSEGESILTGATGAANAPDQNTLVFTNAATVTVGADGNSGNVVIESDSMEYKEVLKASAGATGTTVGEVYFADNDISTPDVLDNDNKMIFRAADSTNKFTQGVQIATGNWDFQGSTTINAQAGDYIQGSDVSFTGNSADPNTSTFTIDGNAIDLGTAGSGGPGATLHLNENVNITYTNGGSLDNLESLKLGDTVANTDLSFGADTVLKVAQIDTGYHADLSGGPLSMAATVDNVFIGTAAGPANHPDGTAITFNSGLQGEHITLNDAVKVTGGLYIDADGTNPVLTIGQQEGGFLLTHDAVAKNSYIEEGAVMDIARVAFNDSNPSHTIGEGVQAIKVLGTADTGALTAEQLQELTDLIGEMAGNLEVDTATLETLLGNNSTVKAHVTSDGTIYYDEIGASGGGGVTPPSASYPRFARPMLSALGDALANNNDISGAALHLLDSSNFSSTDAYNRELTQVMGNTMNSSLSLVHNGAAHAFSRLNATAPTIVGYKTAVAVATPPRPRATAAPVQAAPSGSIGIPIRATDVPPASPSPLGTPPPPAVPIAPAFGSDDGRTNGFWIAPNYIKMSLDGNYGQGYADADVKSMAMVMGYDKWVNDNARLGAFMSYSNPEMETDFQEITADDIQVGVYAQGVVSNGVIMNAALAMGSQDYSSKRDITFSADSVSAYNQELKADYSGRSLSAALEVSRPIALQNSIVVRPSVGYSYQNISLDDIEEEANVSRGMSLAQRISSDSFNIQQARLGTDIGWINPDNTVTVTGKAYLVANMGDTQPEGTASFISAGSAMPFKVRGAELDDTMANLGLGLRFTPAGAEGLIITLDYDALLGSNSQSHNLGLMMRYEF